MDFHPDVPAESKSRGWDHKQWVSLIPYGANQEHPNAYRDILQAMWDNRDQLGYAWRILRDGCCDGCSLGTSGLHDWTMKGVHLCNVRLQLLRFNTAPAMDYHLLEDVGPLRDQTERQLRKLGRLPVPMVRRKGDKGFHRVSWDEAISIVADGLRNVDPKRLGWYMTSRGLTAAAHPRPDAVQYLLRDHRAVLRRRLRHHAVVHRRFLRSKVHGWDLRHHPAGLGSGRHSVAHHDRAPAPGDRPVRYLDLRGRGSASMLAGLAADCQASARAKDAAQRAPLPSAA